MTPIVESELDADPDRPKSHTLAVDGVRLRVSRHGRGRPLLLLNGIGANIELMDPLRRAFRGVETIAYDAPGTGGSDTLRWPRRMGGLADLAIELIDHLGLHRVDVLGYSWGGALAQHLARRHPSRVHRLVLCATGPGVLMVPGKPRALRHLATPRRYYSRSYLLDMAAELYGGAFREDPELLRQQVLARLSRPPSLRGYAWQLAAGFGWSSLPWLHRLEHPTLVVGGDDDPIVPLANARILAALIPRSRLHVVEGGGHLFGVVQPEKLARAVESFLEEEP